MDDLNALFVEFGFEKFEMEYVYGEEACYRAPDGAFYRIDHFSEFYVIEHAENETDAKLNIFEDTDLFDDSLPEEELKEQIRAWIRKYVLEDKE